MTMSHTSTELHTVRTEDSLSLLYRTLRTIIRPLRPHLVSPGKPLRRGSPQLTKAPKSKRGCTIVEHQQESIWLYDFVPSNIPILSSKSKHRIYYFAGGGFQSPPAGEHWKICANLSTSLKEQYQITLVSYPLAPNSPAKESLAFLQRWLGPVLHEAANKDESVSLMGDSAGGNVALSLGFWWAGQRRVGKNAFKNVFVISPATDMRNENPKIQDADRYDPVLSVGLTTSVAKAWSQGLSLADPQVSPVLGDFAALKESGIRIHGVVGTHDVLAPDAIVFRELCEKNNIPGDWLVWEGQMHCFVLASVYGMKEGKQGLAFVETVMKRNA